MVRLFARSPKHPLPGPGLPAANYGGLPTASALTSVSPGLSHHGLSSVSSREARPTRPPDIDVDFEHESARGGDPAHLRDLTASIARRLCATGNTTTVASGRSVEYGRAMGLTEDTDQRDLVAGSGGFFSTAGLEDRRLREEIGLTRPTAASPQTIGADLTKSRVFPRHLSQPSAGFIMTEGRLDEWCRSENATMLMTARSFPGTRTTSIPWVLLKVAFLGAGDAHLHPQGVSTFSRTHLRLDYTLATLPPEDPAVYDMLCRAGIPSVSFSREPGADELPAKNAARTFYDLVIEVAIIRPGPIQW